MTLVEEVEQLRSENAVLREQLTAALARIADLEQQRHDPPLFVTPNHPKPTEPKAPRTKRARIHNHGRKRETPTRLQSHALERCPDCTHQLSGQRGDYRRQVIELPPPPPVEIVEPQVIKRWCPCCQRGRSPQLDLTGQVLGRGRIGVQIASLMACLSLTLRLPIRSIQAYLPPVHQLTISIGAIVEVLHQVRHTLQPHVDALKAQARASPILHADETTWRATGQNGDIWAFSTPDANALRYYEYDASRGQQVVRRMLGGEFAGHLVSDFSCGVLSG